MGSRIEQLPSGGFADLFDRHLRNGTGHVHPGQAAQAWTVSAFAAKCGTDERSVGNWRSGKALPINLDCIERVFFGSDHAFGTEERQALREARARSAVTRL